MANNKITIGVNKKDKHDKTKNIPNEELLDPSVQPAEPEEETPPLDENVWGNDFKLNKQLDKDYLEEKRRYVRVRYIQQLECPAISKDISEEFTPLSRPIVLTMSDLSMGGIGAVCEHELDVGSILSFDITLDNFKYTIQCQVVYCILMEESFRVGLKIVGKNKEFVKHLKILVARISLNARYGDTNPK